MSTPNGIWDAEYLAIYLKELLLAELGEKDPEMIGLPLEALEELRYSAILIAQVVNNQSKQMNLLHYKTNKKSNYRTDDLVGNGLPGRATKERKEMYWNARRN